MKVIRIINNPSDITIPKGMTRTIKFVVSHTTAGPQKQPTQEIFNYWKRHNGWTNVGYHFMIDYDGKIEQLAEISQITNGVKDFNTPSIHFCYKGGVDGKGNPIDNRTEAQKRSQLLIINRLKELFPNAVFLGHRDFSTDKNGNGIIERWEWIKSCPSFDLREWLASQGLDKKIIPQKIVYKLNTPLIKNDTVYAIQLGLNINADGWYGENTTAAVMVFQQKNNLTIDGIVGKNTAKVLAAKIKPNEIYNCKSGKYYIDLLTAI